MPIKYRHRDTGREVLVDTPEEAADNAPKRTKIGAAARQRQMISRLDESKTWERVPKKEKKKRKASATGTLRTDGTLGE